MDLSFLIYEMLIFTTKFGAHLNSGRVQFVWVSEELNISAYLIQATKSNRISSIEI